MPALYGSRAGRMVAMSPTPLQGAYGTSWSAGVGDQLDGVLQDYKDAIKCRFPTYAGANSDSYSLALIGSDSSLPRYPSETDSAYGARLQARWQAYARAGAAPIPPDETGCNILTDAISLGFDTPVLMEYIDFPSDPGDPNVHHSPGGYYDSLGNPWWSRFWLFLDSYDGSPITTGGVWSVGVWGTAVWGFSLPVGTIEAVISSALTWKPAQTLLASIFVIAGGSVVNVWGIGAWGTAVWGASSGSFEIIVNR
jgi:hypothetical protein